MRYDDQKMQEMILYIADRQADDPTYGKVKLAKLIFYSDFEAYARLGEPITGATYQKLPQGPAAREYIPAENRLFRDSAIREDGIPVGKHTQYRIVALRPADTSVFAKDELAIIDEVIDGHVGMSGGRISTKSHLEVGWLVAAMQETIPYETYLVSKVAPSADVIARATAVATAHGWLESAAA